MEKFLETVARYILSNHNSDIQDVCIVFPNRRAGVFFNTYLQELLEGTIIGPSITTVNEFIIQFSEKQKTDRLKLISVLYEVFKEHSKTTESFDEFYFWGEVLLTDFDDVDKYLVDTSALFQNITDLKEIEFQFDYLEESQKEVLKQFWGSLGKWEEFKNKEEFLKIWRILESVYTEFKNRLGDHKIAFDGMIYREIAEQVLAGDDLPLGYKKYYMVGLNALNECEKTVFKFMKAGRKVDFLWDYDTFYVNDIKHEAGAFIRENIIRFPPPDDFLPVLDRFNSKKKIEIIAVPSSHGQAQVIPYSIEDYDNSFDNTAVVLANESLLFPVLGAIPESVSSVNVTMGYPVKNSTVYGFVSLLASLIKNARISEGQEIKFYYKFVFDVLNHQLLSGAISDKVQKFLEETKKKNQIYIEPNDLIFSELHKLIFNIPIFVGDYAGYFLSVLKSIYLNVKRQPQSNQVLLELIVTIYTAIEKLGVTISEVKVFSGQEISPAIFFKLLNQYLNQVSVSYQGEPLSGLQVMGILETRCLDFENVIILGFNEDFWPRAAMAPSYIPHNLRFAFNLPSVDNQDAMYAYYFYRLIQRASNVTLAYNTVKEGVSTGELSRFGNQLIYGTNHNIGRKNFEFRFKSNQIKSLEGKSSKDLVEKLLSRYSVVRPLSPSALNTYINCNYKFYLRYIVGLPEGDEIMEEVDSKLFGNILHKAVEELYKLSGNEITIAWIDNVLKDKIILEQIIRKAFATEYFKTDEAKAKQLVFEGNVRLTYEYIKAYVVQLLKVDGKITPFEIVSLEDKYTWEVEVLINGSIKNIPVGGIIDRLDRVGGKIRIIDYKTGLVNSMSVNSMDSLFNQNIKTQKKEAFQAFLYSLIIKKQYFPDDVIEPGIYALRNIFNDSFNPRFIYARKELVFNNVVDEFEDQLKQLLQEIFSVDNVFHQTEILEHCKYCPYNIMCHRN